MFDEMNKIHKANNNLGEVLDITNTIDILIVDDKGKIIKTQGSFSQMYGCKAEDALGRYVYELEEEGVFVPSVTAKVLETGEDTTVLQTTKSGKRLISIGVAVKNSRNKIIRVVNYSMDIEEYLNLKKWSDDLHSKIDYYNLKINELDKIKTEIKEITDESNKETINNQISVMDDFITENKELKKILSLVKKVSQYDVNILLLGETGVGKSMLAKKIHMLGNHKNGEFVEVNCAAIPKELIESELFGYSKGSFTGARSEGKKGLLEIANNGTIFLDEVCELPVQVQSKLLKVLQDKEVRRVGSTTSKKINFKIIAATNKNIEKEVENGNFRSDLLYRLNTITMEIPSLRKRKEDISIISDYFLRKYNKKFSEDKVISNKVIEMFMKYNWPGNIRELENIIQRLILTCEEKLISDSMLPIYILKNSKSSKNKINYTEEEIDLNKAIDAFEKDIITRYFNKYKSSVKVAKALNISQASAARKIRKYIKSETIADSI